MKVIKLFEVYANGGVRLSASPWNANAQYLRVASTVLELEPDVTLSQYAGFWYAKRPARNDERVWGVDELSQPLDAVIEFPDGWGCLRPPRPGELIDLSTLSVLEI